MWNLYPNKFSARAKVRWAIQTGKIIPSIDCEIKKTTYHEGRLEAHHPDYSKPLDVIWLCHRHHCIIEGRGSYLSIQ